MGKGKVMLNTFFFTFISCAVIAYDISTHGSLESSHTGRYLKQAGLLIYVKPYYSIVEEQTLSLYRWGKKNFPYKEYDVVKNRTVEFSSYAGNVILKSSKEAFTVAKTASINSYNWVSDRIPPDFSDQVLKFLSKSYDVVCHYAKVTYDYSVYSAQKIRKWLAENMTKEKLTWENMEKSFFDVAQLVKVYYSHVSTWVGRKMECLMSA